MMNAHYTAMIFALFAYTFRPILAVKNIDISENCIDNWYIFLWSAMEKFLEPKYHDDVCLKYSVLNIHRKPCNLETYLLPFDSESCRQFRQASYYDREDIQGLMLSDMLQIFRSRGIDGKHLCNILKEFNRMPVDKKTMSQYARVYRTSAVYFPYAYTDKYDECNAREKSVVLRKCILGANEAVFKFFGQYSLPKWRENTC